MKLLIMTFVITSTAFASSVAPVAYRDGTLVSATPSVPCTAANDETCTGADEFVVQSEGITYQLTPLSKGERATFGWGKEFSKYSSLDHQAPGTILKVRDDGRHFFVRVGNRESMYSAIETR